MKKISVILFIVTVAALCACQADIYATLNTLSQKDYDYVSVNVETFVDGITLISQYSFTHSDGTTLVNYREQRLAVFDETSEAPNSQTILLSGSATVRNGKIIGTEGDASHTNFGDISLAFNFDRNNFSDIVTSDSTFEAKIKDISVFLGCDIAASGTVKVTYLTDAISTVVVTYADGGANVALTYSFE